MKMTKMTLMAAAAFGLAAGAQATEVFDFVGRLENGTQHGERRSASAKPARKSPPAQQTTRPEYTKYKLRTGEVVNMSEAQKNNANHHWRAATPQEVAKWAADITVMIIVEENDGTFSSGTGFFINPTMVLTNWHVIRNIKHIRVIDHNNVKYNDATFYCGSAPLDVALLKIPSANSKSCEFIADSDWEQIGEKVYVYGNPQGVEGTFSEGMLSSVRYNGAIFQISAPLDYGSSGSPVFNEYGRVIGIISKKMESSAQINFAISSNAIFEALGLTCGDHPQGFNLGITTGVELRNQDNIATDTAAERRNTATSQTETPATSSIDAPVPTYHILPQS